MRILICLVAFLSLHLTSNACHVPMEEEPTTSPSRPNQPSSRIISNSVRNAKEDQTNQQPQSSGDFLSSLRLDTQYSRTSFNDGDVNSKGYVDERGISISGDLTEDTTLTLGYSRIKYRYGKFTPSTRILAHSYEMALHHNLSDNYGIGGYTFFQDIDIERANGNTYTYGGGALFTTFHDLGVAQFSTASTLTYVNYDTDEDFIVIFYADLSKNFTDWFGAGINASWVDSLTDNAPNEDDNYFTAGADLRFYWKAFTLKVGYEKTLKLSDYRDNTITVNLTYTF
jgi:hypothetical protein